MYVCVYLYKTGNRHTQRFTYMVIINLSKLARKVNYHIQIEASCLWGGPFVLKIVCVCVRVQCHSTCMGTEDNFSEVHFLLPQHSNKWVSVPFYLHFPSHCRSATITYMSHFSWLLRLFFGIQLRSCVSVLCSKCHVTSPVSFSFPFFCTPSDSMTDFSGLEMLWTNVYSPQTEHG